MVQRSQPLTLANAEHSPENSRVCLSNSFLVLQQDWLAIPYGDFMHSDGIQRFTRDAGRKIQSSFNSLRSRAARAFGGLPFYVGHPDHPAFADRHTDDTSYGWIMEIDSSGNEFRFRTKWSDAGRDIIGNARYKYFSPHWAATEIGNENGVPVWEPYELISVGFTNRPVIPVSPLANAQNTTQQEVAEMEWLKWLKETLGLSDESSDDQVKQAVANAKAAAEAKTRTEQNLTTANAEKTTLESKVQTLTGEKTALEQSLAGETTARQAAETNFANERKVRIETLVNAAVADGRITEADKEKWTADLGKDFDGKSQELANAEAKVKTKSSVANRKGDGPQDSKSETILTMVNEHMEKTGIKDFHTAYLAVKAKTPDLFKQEEQQQG